MHEHSVDGKNKLIYLYIKIYLKYSFTWVKLKIIKPACDMKKIYLAIKS